MPDVMTGTGAVSWDQIAYDQFTRFALRPELYFDDFATVKPTKVDKAGSAIVFDFTNDLAVVTAPLSESVDVDAVALSNSNVTVTLDEYGNATVTTAKLRGTAHIPVDPAVANVLGFNAGVSLDTIARNVLQAGVNVLYATRGATDPTSRTTVQTEDLIAARDIRIAKARLVSANVQRINGYYVGNIHPDISIDLREETGEAAWRAPHNYVTPENIYNGEIGVFEGVRFMESPRAPLFVDASNGAGAAGPIDVYGTLIFGAEALAKVWSQQEGNGAQPRVRPGPVTDKLWRFAPMGWYWFGGYGRFREAAIYRIEASSSIGVNV